MLVRRRFLIPAKHNFIEIKWYNNSVFLDIRYNFHPLGYTSLKTVNSQLSNFHLQKRNEFNNWHWNLNNEDLFFKLWRLFVTHLYFFMLLKMPLNVTKMCYSLNLI